MLAESEQMRREADNIGPRVELEHWKMRTAKFNYICEQIKSKPFKAVIGILNVAKSKLLTVNKQVNNGCRKNWQDAKKEKKSWHVSFSVGH